MNLRVQKSIEQLVATSTWARKISQHMLDKSMMSMSNDQPDSEVQALLDQYPSAEHEVVPELGQGTDIQRLTNLVLILSNKVLALTELLEMPDIEHEDISEEERLDFSQKFGAYLSTQTAPSLKLGYDKPVLMGLKPSVRLLVCQMLLDHMVTLNKPAAQIWKDVVTNNGKL